MIAYRPQYQMAQPIMTSPGIVSSPAPSVTSGAPVPEGLFWTGIAGVAAYAGYLTATREKGWKKAAGYVGGIAAGLAATVGLLGVVAPSTVKTLPIRWYWGA